MFVVRQRLQDSALQKGQRVSLRQCWLQSMMRETAGQPFERIVMATQHFCVKWFLHPVSPNASSNRGGCAVLTEGTVVHVEECLLRPALLPRRLPQASPATHRHIM